MKQILISIFIGLSFVRCGTNEKKTTQNEEKQNDIDVVEILSQIDELKFELDNFNVGKFAMGKISSESMNPINEMRSDYEEVDYFYQIEILPNLNSESKFELSDLPEEYNLNSIVDNNNLTYENKLIQIKLLLLKNIILAMQH